MLNEFISNIIIRNILRGVAKQIAVENICGQENDSYTS